MEMIIIIGTVWAFITSVLWLIIGWRAMKAHERLAESAEGFRQAVRAYVKDHLER